MYGECASVVAPAFLMWVGTFRGYGRQLRKYVVNMKKCASIMVPVFLDLGGTFSYVRETIKRISRECAGNVPVSWRLLFLMWVGTFRGYGKQLRQYVVNMGKMWQHHGACFLDLGGKCS
jgi:hypothetical protein